MLVILAFDLKSCCSISEEENCQLLENYQSFLMQYYMGTCLSWFCKSNKSGRIWPSSSTLRTTINGSLQGLYSLGTSFVNKV